MIDTLSITISRPSPAMSTPMLNAIRIAISTPNSTNAMKIERIVKIVRTPVRVVAVEAAHPGEPVIEEHRVSGVTQAPRPGVEPGHEQAGMRLARGPEVLLHTEVELYAVAAEPAAAARCQRGRFRDLVQPEHTAVELAERRLAARRAGQLHVMDHQSLPLITLTSRE